MSEKSLKEKTFSGLGWSSADKIFQQVIVVISGIILARLLTKDDFGLFGILSIFVGISNVLLESGLVAAIIRKKDITQSDYITVFYFNISVAIFFYVVLFFCAPLIAHYYEKDTSFITLSRFLFLSFLFNSFGMIQNAKLYKDINYKFISKNNALSIFISYSVALSLAYFGYGVWALASQVVVHTFVRTCNYWIFTTWRPSGTFNKESFKEMFSFSSILTLGNILGSIVTNIPQNVLGKVYSLGTAGIYNNANKNFNSVLEFLSGSILNIPYTVLSTITDEERLKRVFRKFVRVKAFIIFPTFMGMILVADSFINICLGTEWADAVPILQLLCVGGIFYSLDSSNGDLFKIKNKSNYYLIVTACQAIATFVVIGIIVTLKPHYLWFVSLICTIQALRYFISNVIANKMINYRFIELCKDLYPYFFVALGTTFCGYLLHLFIQNKLALMLCQIPFVAATYIGILYFSGSAIVKEVVDLVKKKTILK